MSQRKGMHSIKNTLLLFIFLNIVILHSLPMNNDTQTPSSLLFYENPSCSAKFLCLISSGRIYLIYVLVVQATLLLATEIK
jgi:hypothetical protein